MSGSQARQARADRRRSFLRLAALVARRDYLRTVRRRGFIVGTAVLPLAIAGLLGLSVVFAPGFEEQAAAPPEMALVNESGLQLVIPAGYQVRQYEQAEAREQLRDGRLREYYIIPADYPSNRAVLRAVAASRGPGLEDVQRRSTQQQALAVVLRATLLERQEIPPDVATGLLEPFLIDDTTVDGEGAPAPSFNAGFMLPYAFTFLFVMSIFITSGYLLQSVTEEKENRVVEILLSSVPPLPLMTGKIVGLGAAGLTQVAIWVATALLALPLLGQRFPDLAAFEIRPPVVALAMVFFVLGYLTYGAIFAAIGALAPGAREAQQYSGFFGFFAVIPLIFAGVFLTDPASPIVVALAIIPLTAPAAMLQILALTFEPPWPLVVASLASLGVFAVLAAVAAARVFRATLLLYGARPSLRGVVGAITARG